MSTIDSGPINGAINSYDSQAINTFVINGVSGIDSEISIIFSGEISRFRELVGNTTSSEIVRFSEEVALRLTTSGEIVRFQEAISSTTSGGVCRFHEKVLDNSVPSFFKRNGWDFDVFIDTTEITHDIIHADISIVKAEDQSTTCTFVVFVNDPVAFIDDMYDGSKPVIVNYYAAGVARRLVTAIIDSPVIDIVNKTVTLHCSQQRDELIVSKMSSLIKTIGKYSKQISGVSKGITDELNIRLKTVPDSVDFDSYNNVNINSWYAKDVADFTLYGSDILYREPQITWQNRSNVINNINIVLNYKHTRLYHLQRDFNWTAPYVGNPTDFNANLYTAPTIETITSALSGTSWQKIGVASYVAQYVRLYNWLGFLYTSPVIQQLDDAGHGVNDPAGNPLYQNLTTASPTTKDVMSASFTAAKRFSQFINEQYNLTVRAPQSITKNGKVSRDDPISYEDAYDSSVWENSAPTSAPPSGAVVDGPNFYFNIVGSAPSALNNTILTAIATAKTAILATHRGTQVVVETPLMPDLELRHTVAINMARLTCKGRVVRIEHLLDAMNGAHTSKITIALFRVPGSASDTAITIPARPTYAPTNLAGGTVVLGSHYGLDQDTTPGADTWNGFIGNKANHYHDNLGNDYLWYSAHTDVFRVDTPAIANNLRAMATLPVNKTYDISIPNNPLTIDTSW